MGQLDVGRLEPCKEKRKKNVPAYLTFLSNLKIFPIQGVGMSGSSYLAQPGIPGLLAGRQGQLRSLVRQRIIGERGQPGQEGKPFPSAGMYKYGKQTDHITHL